MMRIAQCRWFVESGQWRNRYTCSKAYPEVCACGYRFAWDHKTGSAEPIMRALDDDGALLPSSELPIGALSTTRPYTSEDGWTNRGDDGLCITCRTPGGVWWIDSRCSNCGLPTDIEHRCWVRHGTIGHVLHVDKVGRTCAAGAGSIIIGGWHGFLYNGWLEQV